MPLDNDLEPEIVINGYDTGWQAPQQPPEPIVPRFEPADIQRRHDELQAEVAATIPQKATELTFTRIEAPVLGQVWPWVRKGLEIVIARNPGHVSWTPMHVRNALMNNQASLYVVLEDGTPVVFVVITIQNDPFLLVPTVLHVWAEYSEVNDYRAADFAHQQVIALGKALCLDRIEMASTRAAWARRLQRIGMKPALTIYELDLKEQ